MPNYPGSGQAKLLRDNTQGILWSFQDGIIPAPQLSVSFLLERINRSFYPWGLSFEIAFSGNPGAFEIDLMGSNTDNAAYYITLGSITSTNNAYGSYAPFSQYVGRWDMPSNMWPKYVAGFLKTLGNSVNISLTVTK